MFRINDVIINSNKPVIAKVHGAAFAAGCQLVATCDLALSTTMQFFQHLVLI